MSIFTVRDDLNRIAKENERRRLEQMRAYQQPLELVIQVFQVKEYMKSFSLSTAEGNVAGYDDQCNIDKLVDGISNSPLFSEKNTHNEASIQATRILFELKASNNPHQYYSVLIINSTGKHYVLLNQTRKGRKYKFHLCINFHNLASILHRKIND